jgi:hypothetical protein
MYNEYCRIQHFHLYHFFMPHIVSFSKYYIIGYETPDGHVEIRFSKIAKQYIKTYFILDVIATVPIDKILEFIVDDFAVNGLNKAGKLCKHVHE